MAIDDHKPRQPSRYLRISLIRDILIIAITILVAWKLLNAKITLDLSGFSFNDLLALLLALFSVWLSVAFYLKASDTSNQFYDNTYKFTKEISELLGRIEEGFGERLRHLDEGYAGIRDRVERWQDYISAPTNSEIQHEKDEIMRIEQNYQQLIDQLTSRAKIAESEKESIKQQLNAANQDLANAKIALAESTRSDSKQVEAYSRAKAFTQGNRALLYIAHKIHESDPFHGAQDMSFNEVARLLDGVRPMIAAKALDELKQIGWMSEDGSMSEQALRRLRAYLFSLET
jgi:hypothetical protein